MNFPFFWLSADDKELEGMINDAFEVLKLFSESPQGIRYLMDNGTITALAKVISKELYGEHINYCLYMFNITIWN